jgi:peptide/nickel transport system substrate-binding protein/oligopeptide transport system substrate-binding protein
MTHKSNISRRLPALLRLLAALLLVAVSFAAFAAPGTNAVPRRGGTLRLRFPADWQALDPAIAFDADSASLTRLLFRTLLQYDYQGQLYPEAAQSWSVSPDGRIYTFQLRPGNRFVSGREVTADDFICGIERVLDSRNRSPGQGFFAEILGARAFTEGKSDRVAGLRAPDARTLVIELERPSFTFRYVLAMGFASAVPRDRVRELGPRFRFRPEGDGPYFVKDWRRDSHWRFERNPHYTGTNGWFDAVDISIGGDRLLEAMQVERGEIHMARLTAVLARHFRRNPALAPWVQPVTPVGVGFLFFNTQVKPFDDIRVRQALNHAIDRVRVNRATAGLTTPAAGIVPASMPWSNPGIPTYAHDPARARALLKEAGHPEGFKTQLWHMQSREVDHLVAIGIQQDLAEVGVEVELQSVTMAAFEQAARIPGRIPCGVWGWYQDYPDPANFLEVLFHGDYVDGGNNYSGLSVPEINTRIREACDTLEPGKRFQLFRELETRILQEAPWCPLFTESLSYAVHPTLRGFRPHPVWLRCYEDMWLEEERP